MISSENITTFNTTFGRYRFKRYLFGLISAQDRYQKRIESVFEGLAIGLIVNNIAGAAKNDNKHDWVLWSVL